MKSSSARIALILCALCLGAMPALADVNARVIDTFPGSTASLGSQEYWWIRIGYESDQPVSLWARPYRNGIEVKQAMTNASTSYLGSGEALGWFALTQPGEVDEVKIIAGGGTPYRQWEVARHSVRLTWTSGAAAHPARPEWVDALRAAEEERRREETQRRAQAPESAGDVALFNGFMLAVLGVFAACFIVPAHCAWKWRGAWRVAAAAPIVVMSFVVLRIVIDTARDPTSHNLWPFEILQVGIAGIVFVGAVALVRKAKAAGSH